jgi:cleavage and polyadenylation specificity factor subunit 1
MTAHHLAANGLVERFHRTLKAVIMCHADQQWTEALPLVLGIRTVENLQASLAELVYGKPLRIPGELLTLTAGPVDPAHLITELRHHMARLRPVPAARLAYPATFVHLEKCTHIFLRQDTARRALEPATAGGPSPCQLTRSSRPTSSLGMTSGTAPSIRLLTQPWP